MRPDRDVLAADSVVAAAEALLGWRLVSEVGGVRTSVLVTETEAYGGSDDPASHAHRGPTRRNRSMFGSGGSWYVYRSYGIHWCLNVVVGPEGVGMAVLLRGGVPVEGIEVMRRRRGRSDHLTDGPGKLAQALGVTGALDGASVWESPLWLVPAAPPRGATIERTPRVGITRAVERPWRFVLRDSPTR